MSPQRKGTPTPQQYQAIWDAREALEAAQAHLVKVTVDAMKDGVSYREVAPVAGVSDRTALRWGHANGWPTAAQKQAEADEKTKRAELDEQFGFAKVRDILEARDAEEVDPDS